MAHRAGLSVSELNAERMVETAIVKANWRKNRPVMPVMNTQGMNTEASTSPMAITGAETSDMAWWAAARGVIPCSMWCSVASTTTMASSTTMPIASTRPNSESVLRLNPITAMAAKVPMIATGTAIKRNQRRTPVLQEHQHHHRHQQHGVAERVEHLVDRFADVGRGVVVDAVFDALGEIASSAPPSWPSRARPFPGRWSRATGRRPCRPPACRPGSC